MRAEKQPLFHECGPFAVIPQWLLLKPKATDRAIRLYAVLWTYTTEGQRMAFPSRKTLGERMGGCGRDKVDQAISELVAIGGIMVTPRVRAGTTERASNLYELVRTERSVPFCLTCGHDEVGCKCTLRRGQMPTTWGVNAPHGRGQMPIAEVEPPEEEQLNKNHLSSLSDTSEAKVSREAIVKKSKNLPCDSDIILECMRQMSYECYGKRLSTMTDAKFKEIKRTVVDLAGTMLRNGYDNASQFPAYIHGFAAWYEYNEENHPNYYHPAPESYTRGWDDVDWREDWLMKEMNEWLRLEAEEPEHPHTACYTWSNGKAS